MFVGWVSGTGRAGCGHLWRWERMGSIAKEGVEQGLGPGQEEVEQDGQSCPRVSVAVMLRDCGKGAGFKKQCQHLN